MPGGNKYLIRGAGVLALCPDGIIRRCATYKNGAARITVATTDGGVTVTGALEKIDKEPGMRFIPRRGLKNSDLFTAKRNRIQTKQRRGLLSEPA